MRSASAFRKRISSDGPTSRTPMLSEDSVSRISSTRLSAFWMRR